MGVKLQLIITADDLGIDPKRDEGIFQAWSMRAITQASLMVAGPSAKTAAARARRLALPVGLHLDLTETGPSAPKSAVATLLDANGAKRGKHGLREALARAEIDPNHVARETEAQLAAFAGLLGKAPSHVDGHQHIHTVPRVAQVLAPLFARVKVKSTRIPQEQDAPEGFYRQVSDEAASARAIYGKHGVRSSEAFAGLKLMGDNCSAEKLVETARHHAAAASLELMCHVGYVGVGHDDFNRSSAREHELSVYTSKPFAGLSELLELASFESAAAKGALK
jgi:predicted glycoside hydrolase/deacetylase ChbG (UPF0249 family)